MLIGYFPPWEKMFSFSKLPGMIAICIIFLSRTITSAAPVPRHDDDDNYGSIHDIINPLVDGILNPLLIGAGKGVAGAAAGTVQIADLGGDTVSALAHIVGGGWQATVCWV